MRRNNLSAALTLSSFCVACISKSPLFCASWDTRRFSATFTMASKAAKPLKHHSVVSSFIYKFEDGKPLVALFRRSDKVNTYQ